MCNPVKLHVHDITLYIHGCTDNFKHLIYKYIWLVVSTPLKNMRSSVGIIIPNLMEQ